MPEIPPLCRWPGAELVDYWGASPNDAWRSKTIQPHQDEAQDVSPSTRMVWTPVASCNLPNSPTRPQIDTVPGRVALLAIHEVNAPAAGGDSEAGACATASRGSAALG